MADKDEPDDSPPKRGRGRPKGVRQTQKRHYKKVKPKPLFKPKSPDVEIEILPGPIGRPKNETRVPEDKQKKLTPRRSSKLKLELIRKNGLSRDRSREKYNYDTAKEAYLTPVVSAGNGAITWPTLAYIAEKFGIPIDALRGHCTKFCWVAEQMELEDLYWKERNKKIFQKISRRLPTIQEVAFDNAEAAANKVRESIPETADSEILARLVKSNQVALDTAFSAAGLGAPKGVPEALPIVRYSTAEQTVTLGPDGKPVQAGQRQTLLELFQSRVLSGEDAETEEEAV